MKSLILSAAFLLKIAFAGLAQPLNPNDTICPTVGQFQNLLIQSQRATLLQEKITLYETDVRNLSAQIKNLEGQVLTLERLDTASAEVLRLTNLQIETMKTQRAELEAGIATLKKEVKKWRRRTRWTAVAGGVAVIATFLLTK